MENYQGDLADIIRASGGGGATTGSLTSSIQLQGQLPSSDGVTDWQFIMSNNNQIDNHNPLDEFGDPFCNARDPLFQVQVHDLAAAAASSNFFNTSSTTTTTSSCSTDNIIIRSNNNNSSRVVSPKIGDEEEIIVRRAASENVFSRMLQISPNAKLSTRDSPALAVSPKPPSLTATNAMISSTVNNSSSKASFVENGGLQISSPRSTGIKRRKCQAKKVVCIPAPTPANSSRTSGEVVPSDLWAWRKYGQKPIKGSPYPRGYYRCSSSKGCSARKQVERSRTDPNMLVITYTSEHNHPWPTQRNALAGSTRSQPSKTSGSASKTSSSLTSGSQQSQRSTNLKEEQKEISLITDTNNISSSIVKEEMEDLDKQMAEMDDVEFSQGFQQSYKPSLPLPDSNRSEDFFADLGELEAGPLNLLFTQAYSGEEQGRRNKAPPPLDPLFSFYDWTDNNSNHNNSNNYSIEEDSSKGS